MKEIPRVLVISNECFSKTSSNGRTLGGFFAGWPLEKIAQFYINPGEPDYTVCKKYFLVTDRGALRALLKRENKENSTPANEGASTKKESRKVGRNPITMLLREFVWNSRMWMKKEFEEWVKEFNPDIVLLQAGDSGFMFRLAEDISKKYRIPLVIYNSEGYYFKKFDYFRSVGLAHMLYPVFRGRFCRQFQKTMKQTSYVIYICDKLRIDYAKEFDTPSEVIYTATKVEGRSCLQKNNGDMKFSYLGNLGVGRHDGLIEIANALQKISPKLKLEVYGKTCDEEVLSTIKMCEGIEYKGFITYDEVINVMQTSDVLVHCENFSDYYKEDLKYAFSTKIADCLASGTCFLLYAPHDVAAAQYLKENEAAYVVADKDELEKTLQILADKAEARDVYLDNARKLVENNHNSETCAKKFQEILMKAVDKNENSSS